MNYTFPTTDNEIQQILDLQSSNLIVSISEKESKEQGFVTVKNDFETLKAINEKTPHIIAKDREHLAGYALSLPASFEKRVPILKPMFDLFRTLQYDNKTLTDYNYFVLGQICVSKKYRGQGVFRNLYETMRNTYGEKYDFLITEVALRNTRSMRAHANVGFKVIYEYQDYRGEDWAIVLWDWRK